MALALNERLRQFVHENGLGPVGIYFRPIPSPNPILIDAGRSFHAASLMKLPVMMEAFRRAQDNELDLLAPLPVYNRFVSRTGGETFQLDPEEDSDPALYEFVGSAVPAIDLVWTMIARSSNLATNLLLDRLGVRSVQSLIDRLGGAGMKVERGVDDHAAFQAGIYNRTNAEGIGNLLFELATGSFFSQENREKMLEILTDQEHRQGIPKGVPQAVRVCNKTGWISTVCHDAGIVEMNHGVRFVLVVLCEGQDQTALNAFIAKIAGMCAESIA